MLTSQGSWIEIENIIQAFFSAAGGCSEISVCFPLATQLPEMHLFSDIEYRFYTILIPCLLVLYYLDVLHAIGMHACRQKFGVS